MGERMRERKKTERGQQRKTEREREKEKTRKGKVIMKKRKVIFVHKLFTRRFSNIKPS